MIAHLEVQVSKLEGKPEITSSDSVKIQAHMEKFSSLDSDFKAHHFHIIRLVDKNYEDTLTWEQSMLDDHEDRMNDIMDRLTQLSHNKSSPTVTAPLTGQESAAEPSRFLRRKLDYMKTTLRSINSTIESLTPGPDLDTVILEIFATILLIRTLRVCFASHLYENIANH